MASIAAQALPDFVRSVLQWLLRYRKRLSLVFSALLLALPILVAVREEVLVRNTVLGAISVPPSLNKRGYSAAVLALEITDSYDAIGARASTVMHRQGLQKADVPSGLVIADSNPTLTRIVVGILHFFISDRHDVSGEVVETDRGKLLLTLRLDGNVLSRITADHAEDLAQPAARAIMRGVQPFVLASWYYDLKDYPAAEQAARDIIRWRPGTDINTVFAHNLLGLLYRMDKNYPAAMREFQTAIALAPRNPVSHINLGAVYSAMGRPQEAKAEDFAALRLDLGNSAAHANLGGLLLNEPGKEGEAELELQFSVQRDPSNAIPHGSLGRLYQKTGRRAQALAEFRTAARLSPESDGVHNNLGYFYLTQTPPMLDQSLAESRLAIRYKTVSANPYLNVARALQLQAGKPGAPADALLQACAALHDGARKFPKEKGFGAQAAPINRQAGRVICGGL